MHFAPAFALMPGMVMAALFSSCAPQAREIPVKSDEPGVLVKELQVTGRPIHGASDLVSDFQIEGYNGPNEQPVSIQVAVASEHELEEWLDPREIYSVIFYLQEYKQPDGAIFYDATLSKVEQNGSVVIDSSICDVHGYPMRFAEGDTISYGFEYERENQDLRKYHNHGYHIIRGYSFGRDRVWSWRCPECAKKVDSFRSKIESL